MTTKIYLIYRYFIINLIHIYMFTILLIITGVVLLYCYYQLCRNHTIFNIRNIWIDNDDDRWYKYTYDYMMDPKLNNWFGLKYPRDKDYI